MKNCSDLRSDEMDINVPRRALAEILISSAFLTEFAGDRRRSPVNFGG